MASERSYALDGLRGWAILTMVLSSAIAFGVLPAWMYHAQTPPPTHVFNPDIPGLTWVDLVFPFFLFSMGAAFPFSVGSRMAKGDSVFKICVSSLIRGLQLAFFAILIQHFYPYVLSSPQDVRSWLLALACFALLFPMFMRLPSAMPEVWKCVIRIAAYGIAAAMLLTVDYAGGAAFSLSRSNIIILILANMAFFGTVTYLFTRNCPVARVVLSACVLGILVSSGIENSWTAFVFDWTPLPWLYKFNFIKYLPVVLCGTLAGDMLKGHKSTGATPARLGILTAVLSILLIISALVLLQTRHTGVFVLVFAAFALCGFLALRGKQGSAALWLKLWLLGTAYVAVALCFEPFQGGIKKDHATLSYLIMTPGLACFALVFFHVICDEFKLHRATAFLTLTGQNPMLAYVCPALLINPLLNLSGLMPLLGGLDGPWTGVLRGMIVTAVAICITVFFTRRKCFWRT